MVSVLFCPKDLFPFKWDFAMTLFECLFLGPLGFPLLVVLIGPESWSSVCGPLQMHEPWVRERDGGPCGRLAWGKESLLLFQMRPRTHRAEDTHCVELVFQLLLSFEVPVVRNDTPNHSSSLRISDHNLIFLQPNIWVTSTKFFPRAPLVKTSIKNVSYMWVSLRSWLLSR